MTRLNSGIVALVILASGCSASDGLAIGATEPATAATANATANANAEGSRAYRVESLDELSGRADAVVVGTLGGAPAEEPADEESKSGLKARVTPFEVETWIKGQGQTSIALSELPLGQMLDEIANIEKGSSYVLFLERSSVRGQLRYNLIGGVGAYRVESSGVLVRTERAPDTFPAEVAGLPELTQEVRGAPATWSGR